MAKTTAAAELRELTTTSSREAARGQGRAVQPALPGRHRSAREPRPAARRQQDIARIYTVLRERELGITADPTTGAEDEYRRRSRRGSQRHDDDDEGDETRREHRDERARHRKVREGLVVSDKMDKTVVVAVEDRVKHALYGKVLRRTEQAQGARRAERRAASATAS